MRIVSANEIEQAVGLADLLEPVAQALTAYSRDEVPESPMMLFGIPGGEAHVKAAVMGRTSFWSLKAVASVPANRDRELPAAHATVTLFETATGRPTVPLDDAGGRLTGLRTAAAGALAARLLAPATETLLVLGTGTQARLQAQAFSLVRPFARLLVWGRDETSAARTAADLLELLPGIEVEVARELRWAVAEAQTIVTATASERPLVRGEWLRAGQHVTAVGADDVGKRELDDAAFARADRIYVDSIEMNLRFGDVAAAIEHGALSSQQLTGELGALAETPTPRAAEEITIAKLVGLGVQDLAAATTVLERLAAR
jgi:ornithine cyclodeaminase/alanine dehydrogenase-like protein (mu-crystallin family)